MQWEGFNQSTVIINFQYKYAEGTDWERRALYNGYEELKLKEFDVEFFIPETEYKFGQGVFFVVTVTNKAEQEHRIRGNIQCRAVTYNGKWASTFCCNVMRCNVM